MQNESVITQLQAMIGKVHTSDWHTITQSQINAFADATLDHQWIHVDEARARQSSPLSSPGNGTTVAHGFLTISLLSHFMDSAVKLPPVKAGVNYGCDKLRFVTPVPVNSRVRGVITLTEVSEALPMLQLKWQLEVQLEGSTKPAAVALWITRVLP
jgi:acyl dehydratase